MKGGGIVPFIVYQLHLHKNSDHQTVCDFFFDVMNRDGSEVRADGERAGQPSFLLILAV